MSRFNRYTGKAFSQRYYQLLGQRGNLPVSNEKDTIIDTMVKNPVFILEGETGSGKTTQTPQYALEVIENCHLRGKILVTQPRKIAARECSARCADELDVKLGDLVGYSTRDSKRFSTSTKLLFTTEGIPLAQLAGDSMLNRYNVIIIDEAHERSAATDTLLGVIKGILSKRQAKNDLRLVIMSATLDANKFSDYFGGCPHLKVPGRTHEVKIVHAKVPYRNEYESEAARRAISIHQNACRLQNQNPKEDDVGDILIFAAGDKDISKIKKYIESEMREYSLEREVEVLSLKSCLPAEKQAYILDRDDFSPRRNPKVRRIIIATNVAETSITLPRIKYVIDCGYVKLDVFDPTTRTYSLLNTPISRSQADQRAGRAGRLSSGVCFRLYTNRAYQKEMKENSPIELCRTNLDGLLLMFLSRGLGEVYKFDWLSRPSPGAIIAAYQSLYDLQAVTKYGAITEHGRRMAKLSLEPKYAAVVLEAEKRGCSKDCLAIIAVLLGEPPVKNVPPHLEAQAEKKWKKLAHNLGDHLTYRTLLYQYIIVGPENRKQFCTEYFLSHVALERAMYQYKQLLGDAKSANIQTIQGKYSTEVERNQTDINILQAFLSGCFHQTAKYGNNLRMPGAQGQYYIWSPIGPIPVGIEMPSFLPYLSTYILYDNAVVTAKSHYIRCVSIIKEADLRRVAPGSRYFLAKYQSEYE